MNDIDYEKRLEKIEKGSEFSKIYNVYLPIINIYRENSSISNNKSTQPKSENRISFDENLVSKKLEAINKFCDLYKKNDIKNVLSDLLNYYRNKRIQSYNYYNSLYLSLRANTNDLINLNSEMKDISHNDKKRWKKLFAKSDKLFSSYCNLQYFPLLEKMLESNNEKPIILAIAAISNDDDDKSNIISEIKEILYLSLKENSFYTVIPLFGCTTDVFKSALSILKVSYLHIAGHGYKVGKIEFLDSNMYSNTFYKYITKSGTKHVIGSFLNICYSNNLYENLKIGPYFYDIGIGYDGILFPDSAYEFSLNFYEKIIIDDSDYLEAFYEVLSSKYDEFPEHF